MPDPGARSLARHRVLRRIMVIVGALAGIGVSVCAVYFVVRLARTQRAEPARCSSGFLPQGPRCCAPGQKLDGVHCAGKPTSCPPGMSLAIEPTGCVIEDRRVPFRGGKLIVREDDWQSEGVITPRSETVAPFALDRTEVTYARWSHCIRAGTCVSLDYREPGQPVTGVDPREAERFCRFAGGRLPTSAEWLMAAFGTEGRRFPWGPTGLVCRRAAFGLVAGPCASGGGLELAGSRPDGASTEGVLDLSGNAAEWTLESGTQYVARGGSYRAQSALEVVSWASETPPRGARWVGFRCAYDSSSSPR